MRLLLSVVSASLLTSCYALRNTGGELYDRALDDAVRFTCNDTSVGSVRRRFGYTDAGVERWARFCFGDAVPLKIPPDLEVQP